MASVGETGFQAIAYDPNLGTADGIGIAEVFFTLTDPNGQSDSRSDGQPAYCFSGGGSPCNTLPPGQWNSLPPGTYTLSAQAISSNGLPSASTSVSFTKP